MEADLCPYHPSPAYWNGIVSWHRNPRSACRGQKTVSPGGGSRSDGYGRNGDYRESDPSDEIYASVGSSCCCGWTVAAHLELAYTRPGLRLTVDMAAAVVAGRRELDAVGRLELEIQVPGGMVVSRALVRLMAFGSLQTMALELEVERRSLLDKVAAEVVLDRRMILVRICW